MSSFPHHTPFILWPVNSFWIVQLNSSFDMTLGKLFNLSISSCVQEDNSAHLLGMPWVLKQLIHVKPLRQFLIILRLLLLIIIIGIEKLNKDICCVVFSVHMQFLRKPEEIFNPRSYLVLKMTLSIILIFKLNIIFGSIFFVI